MEPKIFVAKTSTTVESQTQMVGYKPVGARTSSRRRIQRHHHKVQPLTSIILLFPPHQHCVILTRFATNIRFRLPRISYILRYAFYAPRKLHFACFFVAMIRLWCCRFENKVSVAVWGLFQMKVLKKNFLLLMVAGGGIKTSKENKENKVLRIQSLL